MDVSAIKLSSGEVVYGVIEKIEDDLVYVANPMVSEVRKQSDGATAMVLNRYIAMIQEEVIPLNANHVVSIAVTTDALAGYYNLSVAYAEFADEMFDTNVKNASNHLKEILDTMVHEYDDVEGRKDFYKSILENIKPNGNFQ